jgi:hypothetical protein
VSQLIQYGGGTPPAGCGDARQAAPLLQRLVTYYDSACGTEPTQMTCQAVSETICALQHLMCDVPIYIFFETLSLDLDLCVPKIHHI